MKTQQRVLLCLQLFTTPPRRTGYKQLSTGIQSGIAYVVSRPSANVHQDLVKSSEFAHHLWIRELNSTPDDISVARHLPLLISILLLFSFVHYK